MRLTSIARPMAAVAAVVFATQMATGAPIRFYVTGDLPPGPGAGPKIFEVVANSAVAGSGVVAVDVSEAHGLDGIDFVPGTGDTEVVTTAPSVPQLSHQRVSPGPGLGAVLADFITSTDVIAPAPPAVPGSTPSSVRSTSTHVYYTENQFGFITPAAPEDHRVMRHSFGAGTEDVVFDGAGPHPIVDPTGTPLGGPVSLRNFEGIEIHDPDGGGPGGDRLYFFAENPLMPAGERAQFSIGLAGGVWDTTAPVHHFGGLHEDDVVGDGSDELDHDPFSGLIFGTNIVNGEVTALDPVTGLEVVPGTPGSMMHFVDSGSNPWTGLAVDGIRSDGEGHLVFVGRGGVIGAIDIASVFSVGAADPASVYALFDGTAAGYVFDELTPLVAIPEPSTFGLALLGLLGLGLFRRRRVRI